MTDIQSQECKTETAKSVKNTIEPVKENKTNKASKNYKEACKEVAQAYEMKAGDNKLVHGKATGLYEIYGFQTKTTLKNLNGSFNPEELKKHEEENGNRTAHSAYVHVELKGGLKWTVRATVNKKSLFPVKGGWVDVKMTLNDKEALNFAISEE